ncbi:IGS10 protein, partial [Columbina picui]|nr:IGS10 protein [Columbina picui]
EDGRILVVETGTLTLRTADTFDTGLYHCIGTNGNDADALTFRITVVDPYVEHNSVNGAHVSAFVGSTLDLPCTSTAVPDAAVSWVLPEREILHHSVRNKHVFDNGTLRIQGVTERDSGYYTCVAANQYGVDLLVLQVLVREDETTRQTKHVAAGEWDEGDGSGHAVLAPAVAQNHPVAALEASTARGESAAASRGWVAASAQRRSSYGRSAYRLYRDRAGRRFRGHRRQFGSSARRVDPQRWAAFLEKTKRNSTLVEKRGEVATKPPLEVRKSSEAAGDEEEASGDVPSPEEELMIPVTARATAAAAGRAMGRATPAGPGVTPGSPPAGKPSLLGLGAVTPLPAPSSDSREPRPHLTPAVTNSWERPELSQIPADGLKQSTVPNGASRTSTLLPAAQSFVYAEQSNNQHLKSVSAAPETDIMDTSKSVSSQSTLDKLHGFTESIGKISTKTDQQISVVTVSDPSLGFGHSYVHSTQKPVTPEPPLAPAVITHQQIQNMQDPTTWTPQTQQQRGKGRKTSGRRRLVRPGRIPGMKEHKFSFGRPGSVRGDTAVAADVQPNMKYVPGFPTSDSVSSSIHQRGPEAPLSPPAAVDVPLEQPAGARHPTAWPRAGERDPGARQTATAAAVPALTEDAQDAPQWKSEPSAPFQTSIDRVQLFSSSLPTTAMHTAHGATEMPQTVRTTVSSALQSVLTSNKPRTSPKKSQRGKVTWDHRFGNGAREVPKKLPKPWTDVFPSTEVLTVLPETTASSVSETSPLHMAPVPAGGNHSSAHYSNGKPEDLPTAKSQSYSSPATTAAKHMEVMNLKAALTPIITPQTDTKTTKRKVFRMGRRRGQRRKRPPKTPALPSPLPTAATRTSATPVTRRDTHVTTQPSATPVTRRDTRVTTQPSAIPVTRRDTRVTSQPSATPVRRRDTHVTSQPSATPVTRRDTHVTSQPSATSPPDSLVVQSPPSTTQTPLLRSEPSGTTSTGPAPRWAVSGSDPARHSAAGDTSHQKTAWRVFQDNHIAEPTFPAGTQSGTRAPAAPRDTPQPHTQRPSPLP